MSKTLFWLDDDYSLIGALTFRLREAGYNIVTLRTFAEALEALDELLACELLILDILLPSGGAPQVAEDDFYSGLTLLKLLQEEYGFDRPVVVCSVVTQTEVLSELEQRSQKVLYKPDTTATELKNVVEEVLSG